MPDYTKEQLWKLYEKLPEELKEAIFSAETADNIYNICTKNKIEDDRISEVARYTGRVLMGILPIDEFQETLEKEVKLRKIVAKKIAQEINRFVFFPVKESLALVSKIEAAPPLKPLPERPPEVTPPEVVPPPEAMSPEEKEKPKKPDVYRETIE